MRPIAACAGMVVESTRVSQVTPESPGIPYAMVYGLLRDLPGDRLSCHRRRRRSADLTPAPRRQDHAAWPSARQRSRQKRPHVHRSPPRVRDVRETPLYVGRDDGEHKVIWFFGKSEYFCARGLTAMICPSKQIDERTLPMANSRKYTAGKSGLNLILQLSSSRRTPRPTCRKVG
jgi:hypothetical protein